MNFHPIVLACALLTWVLGTSGILLAQQPPESPFFWRIEAPDSQGKPSWLLGTFHVGDPRITTMHPDTERALDGADAVFTELPIVGSVFAEARRRMTLKKGQTLRDLLPADLYARVEHRFDRSPGAMASLDRMQPWAVAGVILMSGPIGEPYDVQIFKDAKNAGKEVGGLETVDEQCAAFAGGDADGNVAFLRQVLDLLDQYRAADRDYLEELIQAYVAGDGPALVQAADQMLRGDPELWGKMYAPMVTDRNLRMADRMAAKMRAAPERSFFFAIGARHCLGDLSVVELLRDRGFKVSRVPATGAAIEEEIQGVEQRLRAQRQQLERLQAERQRLRKTG